MTKNQLFPNHPQMPQEGPKWCQHPSKSLFGPFFCSQVSPRWENFQIFGCFCRFVVFWRPLCHPWVIPDPQKPHQIPCKAVGGQEYHFPWPPSPSTRFWGPPHGASESLLSQKQPKTTKNGFFQPPSSTSHPQAVPGTPGSDSPAL